MKKEYTIFCICNGGKPYNISTYSSLEEVKFKLYDMVSLERERNRPYYVHNDFYENEFPASLNCKIFCIKEREITDWSIYSEEKENKRITNENNVILFKDHI